MDITLFNCPTYNARLTAKGCADMRKRPLLTDKTEPLESGKERMHRHPSCNDDCPHLLAQRVGSKTAWQLIREGTGCDTQDQVAKKIGTYQSKVSQFLVKLAKGITPTGREWGRLLEITKLMPEELLLAARANNISVKPSTPSLHAAPSSPPQPSGPDLPMTTGPDGPSDTAEPMPGQAPPVIVHGDKVPPTMMGTDPADALINTEQAQELRDSAESPAACGGFVNIVLGRVGETPSEQTLHPGTMALGAVAGATLASIVGGMIATEVEEAMEEHKEAPDLSGWEFYDSKNKPLDPAIWVTKDNHLCINADAVGLHKLGEHTHARLGLHKSSGKVCIMPTYEGHGALSLQRGKGRGCRYVSAKGFLDRYSLNPARSKPFPVTGGPSGMLIVSIEPQAEEAMKEAS
ncbi:MAG: hypothetical protein KKF77_03560 [Proteobacteria bacterium]|nr:hypothetical protein [Pseudomonadota bacterium]